MQYLACECGVETGEKLGASAVAVAWGPSGLCHARRVLPVQGMSAKGERASPGVCSGASSNYIHSFIPSESYLHDRASSAMSFLTSSVPRFTQPLRQSVQRDVGILPHQQSVQRFAGRHLFALASSAVLTPFPPRHSVQHDVYLRSPHHTSVQRSVGLRVRNLDDKRLSFLKRDDFTLHGAARCAPNKLYRTKRRAPQT